jgi:hypothetical protein
MKRLGVRTLTRIAVFTCLAVVNAGSALSVAQDTGNRTVNEAQRAVRERITNREGRRDLLVRFGNDARTESASNADVRVRGTGSLLRSDDGKTRLFSYEAVVNTRNGNVSDIQYDWRGDWYSSDKRAAAVTQDDRGLRPMAASLVSSRREETATS